MAARRGSIARAAIILAGSAVLLWLSVSVTLTLTLGTKRPDLAMALWPWGGAPREAIALSLVGEDASSGDIEKALRLAREAVERAPASVTAVRTLAVVEARKDNVERARALFEAAEKLSKRDQVVELWLLEDAVGRNDIHTALIHYDRVMRVRIPLRDTLLPILALAAEEKEVERELIPIVASRPNWWEDFASLFANTSSNIASLESVGRQLRLDRTIPRENVLIGMFVQRLVTLKAYPAARRFAASATPGGMAALLSDGDFEGSGYPPFAWELLDNGEAGAYRDRVADGGFGLRLRIAADRSDILARQMVTLAPGAYALSGTAGNIAADRRVQPVIELSCIDGPSVTRLNLPASGENGRAFSQRFQVPVAGCPAQWLAIRSQAIANANADAWLDKLAITPAGAKSAPQALLSPGRATSKP